IGTRRWRAWWSAGRRKLCGRCCRAARIRRRGWGMDDRWSRWRGRRDLRILRRCWAVRKGADVLDRPEGLPPSLRAPQLRQLLLRFFRFGRDAVHEIAGDGLCQLARWLEVFVRQLFQKLAVRFHRKAIFPGEFGRAGVEVGVGQREITALKLGAVFAIVRQRFVEAL